MGRQHQGMDRPGVRQVPEGSGEHGKMEKTGCKIICGAPTTLAVKGLMMMMMISATGSGISIYHMQARDCPSAVAATSRELQSLAEKRTVVVANPYSQLHVRTFGRQHYVFRALQNGGGEGAVLQQQNNCTATKLPLFFFSQLFGCKLLEN